MKESTLNVKSVQIFFANLAWLAIVIVFFLISLMLRDILTAAVASGTLFFLGFAIQNQVKGNVPSNLKNQMTLTLIGGTLITLIVNALIQVNFSAGIQWSGLFDHWPLYTSAIGLWVYAGWLIKSQLGLVNKVEPTSTFINELVVKDRGGEVILLTDEISHIQADGDYIKVYVRGRYYLIRQTLRDILQNLDPSYFRRIHRSTIVNMEFIGSLKPHQNSEYFVYLKNGTELKLSRSYRNALTDFSLA